MPSLRTLLSSRSSGSSATTNGTNINPDDDSSSDMRPIYIAGIVLAGTIAVGLLTWFAIRKYRKRSQAKRESDRGAAFLNVKGLLKEGDEKQTLPEDMQVEGQFSRAQMTESVVLPSKVVTRPTMGRNEDIIEFHRQSGNFPRPFAPFALPQGGDGSGPGKRTSTASWVRHSFMSGTSFSGASQNRFSVISSRSGVSSIDSNPTSGTPRKIRQTFTPVLPDELLVSLGERLTVVQSFDDGWCVVGRENSVFAQTAQSLFKQNTEHSNIELGVVPAWVFIKPVKGLRAERPIRSSSLGITVEMQGPAFSSREEIISWSNF